MTIQGGEFPRTAGFLSLNFIYVRTIIIRDYNFTWQETLPLAFMEERGQVVFKRNVDRKMLRSDRGEVTGG